MAMSGWEPAGHFGQEKLAFTSQSLQSALERTLRHIERAADLVLIVGKPGTGKSHLLDLLAHRCAELGVSLARVDRGDLADSAFAPVQVLLVDEAELLSRALLDQLTNEGENRRARTVVLAYVHACPERFSLVSPPPVIELAALRAEEARELLGAYAASAGRADAFTPEASALLIESTKGLPRPLLSAAKLSLFCAALESASQVEPRHVREALTVQLHYLSAPIKDLSPSSVQAAKVPEANSVLKRPSLAERATAGRIPTNLAVAAAGRLFSALVATVNQLVPRVESAVGEASALMVAVLLGGFFIPWLLSPINPQEDVALVPAEKQSLTLNLLNESPIALAESASHFVEAAQANSATREAPVTAFTLKLRPAPPLAGQIAKGQTESPSLGYPGKPDENKARFSSYDFIAKAQPNREHPVAR